MKVKTKSKKAKTSKIKNIKPAIKNKQNLMPTKKLRETKCQKCKQIFYRKLVPSKENGRELTKINDITY